MRKTLTGLVVAVLAVALTARAATASASADKSGTDPSNYQRTLSASNEHAVLTGGDRFLNTTSLGLVQPFHGAKGRLSVELPVSVSDIAGPERVGLADGSLRIGHLLLRDRRKAMAASIGVVMPMATRDELGSGKYSLEPSGTAILFLSRQWIFAPSLKHTVSVAGDSDRRDINLTSSDFYVVWRAADLRKWIVLDPALSWNWNADENAATGFVSVTLGRMLRQAKDGAMSGFVKPGFGVGRGRSTDWSVEIGVKVVGI